MGTHRRLPLGSSWAWFESRLIMLACFCLPAGFGCCTLGCCTPSCCTLGCCTCLLPFPSVRGFFFSCVLVIGMLSSNVTSWMSVRILVFSRSIWLCSCIACCLMTGRSPDRTSWVPPGLRVHGQGGGLTTIGTGAGARADAGISLHSNILRMSEGLLLPPFSILLVVLFAFQVLYCRYFARIARPIDSIICLIVFFMPGQ